MFLHLNLAGSGSEISVNIDLVETFEPHEDGTDIAFGPESKSFITVTQTYEQVKDLVRDSI